jgi:hypothetical protein
MTCADLMCSVAGWWLRKIVSSFSGYHRSLPYSEDDDRATNSRMLSITRIQIDTVNKCSEDYHAGCHFLAQHEIHNLTLSKALRSQPRLLIVREFLWWSYQHLALTHHDLRERYKCSVEEIRAVWDGGTAPWQTEWEFSDPSFLETLKLEWEPEAKFIASTNSVQQSNVHT